ncbi:MAG: PQQ-binding-like beta-propeller repeat protein [Sedimentisphaerales bacterium]|nr:PQQ-binding-like beta-propeller repeat protein [Sedimentisphaerales bacterium]
MPKKLFFRLSLAIVLISLIVFSPGCQNQSRTTDADLLVTSGPVGVSAEILAKAGLDFVWSANLHMGRASDIKQVFYHKAKLYVLNNRNVLWALDGRTGAIEWSRVLAESNLHCAPVQYYQDSLILLLGNTFIQINDKGHIIKKLQVNPDYPASTSAARSEDYLYLGSLNKRFYCLKIDNGIPLWQNRCNREPVGTITLTSDKVYFVTGDNWLYVSAATKRDLAWKFQAAGELPGVIVDNDQCLLPSADTALYCFDPESGKMLWKHLCGGSLFEMPVITADSIYQPVSRSSLLCLERYPDNENGSVRWTLDEGLALLAQHNNLSYVITRNQEITVMDNQLQRRKMSFYLPDVDLFARNNEDAMILLASYHGKIIALKPRDFDPNLIETKPITTPQADDADTEKSQEPNPDQEPSEELEE